MLRMIMIFLLILSLGGCMSARVIYTGDSLEADPVQVAMAYADCRVQRDAAKRWLPFGWLAAIVTTHETGCEPIIVQGTPRKYGAATDCNSLYSLEEKMECELQHFIKQNCDSLSTFDERSECRKTKMRLRKQKFD